MFNLLKIVNIKLKSNLKCVHMRIQIQFYYTIYMLVRELFFLKVKNFFEAKSKVKTWLKLPFSHLVSHFSLYLHIFNFLRISFIYIITLISHTPVCVPAHMRFTFFCSAPYSLISFPFPWRQVSQLLQSALPALPLARRSSRAAALTARLIFNFEHRCQLSAPVQPAAACHAY